MLTKESPNKNSDSELSQIESFILKLRDEETRETAIEVLKRKCKVNDDNVLDDFIRMLCDDTYQINGNTISFFKLWEFSSNDYNLNEEI